MLSNMPMVQLWKVLSMGKLWKEMPAGQLQNKRPLGSDTLGVFVEWDATEQVLDTHGVVVELDVWELRKCMVEEV